ncbi:MAG: hypothetical protein AAFR51_18555, partial [Pseudomonadota bacterium]
EGGTREEYSFERPVTFARVMRAGDFDQVAKIVQEGLGVANLIPVGVFPSFKETIDVHCPNLLAVPE